jgi:mannose-6-phosphate isomerase-like protein (cupin superfamily)
MAIMVTKPGRDEILRGVARFDEIKGVREGLPDMALPECRRTFYNVLGFEMPEREETYSPFGEMAKPRIGHMRPGFGLAFVAAAPGKGVLMHAHDTNETFIVIEGRWKLEWEGDRGTDHVILGPKDVVSFPIGVHRRFECVEAAAGKPEGLLLAVIAGEAPEAEYSPEARQRMAEGGVTLQPA